MEKDVISKLTAHDNQCARVFADKIVQESERSNTWYACFDDIASLLDHPNSFVRNRVLSVLAALARWDEQNLFDSIILEFLAHVTDEKPITARQCIKALAQVGTARPQHIPQILACFRSADLSGYKDSMRQLIERDMAQTERALTSSANCGI